MALDPSTGTGDVVEWGTDAEPRRSWLSTFSGSLGVNERHLTLGLAAAGAALFVLSLLTGWQVVTLPGDGPGQEAMTVDLSVGDIGVWGTTYTLALLGLLACAALVLYGPVTAGRSARVAGLGWAAGLGGLMIALIADLQEPAFLFSPVEPPTASYGAGPFLALAAVAVLAAAIYLPGQRQAPVVEPPPVPVEAPASPAVPRPVEVGYPQPVDLTVSEAPPFVHLPDQRDR